jgi:tetratricopeptide (TPR) repeat protein
MCQNNKDTVSNSKMNEIGEEQHRYVKILEKDHKDPAANHNLAEILREQGDIKPALRHFKIALESSPLVTKYWMSYASCLYENNFSDIAAQVINQARMLGLLTSELEALESKYKKKYHPTEAQTNRAPKKNRERLLRAFKKKNYEKAEKIAKDILNAYPLDDFTLKCLGDIYNQHNDHLQAIKIALKILEIHPESHDAHHNLGIHCQALGRINEAEIYFKKALEINPVHIPSYDRLALLFKQDLRYKEAVGVLELALSKAKGESTLILLAEVLLELEELEASKKYFSEVLKISPNNISAIFSLGRVHLSSGNFETAGKYFSRALDIDPQHGASILAKTRLLAGNISEQELSELELLLEDNKVSKETKWRIGFSLAVAYEQRNQIERAYNAYLLGNRIAKELSGYKVEEDISRFEKIRATNIKIASLASVGLDARTTSVPIFIMGMPRSGTTLIEQVLSGHSCVSAGGEIPFALRLGLPIVEGKVPLTEKSLNEFRERYIEELSQYSNEKIYVTDKLPHNFLVYRLIQTALPEAKMIFVERDPAATLWGNFKQPFTTPILKYANDLDDLVEYWHLYSALIESYSLEFSSNLFPVNYESFTDQPNENIKRLLAWLDLDIEDSCFSPEKNYRSVKTASQAQIREKIYRGSSTAWKAYETELCGKFANL